MRTIIVKQTIGLIFSMMILGLIACKGPERSSRVLLLFNTDEPQSILARNYLIPYLGHFGIAYDTFDLKKNNIQVIGNYALVVTGHPGLFGNDTARYSVLVSFMEKQRRQGTGLVSFDPLFTGKLNHISMRDSVRAGNVGEFIFSTSPHYITACHRQSDTLHLFRMMELPDYQSNMGTSLIRTNMAPLLSVDNQNGRTVTWFSMDWMNTKTLGPLGGLDDCLWRSMVWAARKPFAMHALPPLVTMRVDDVAGRGELWGKSPFYWVKAAYDNGFRPWLGLFIYNLNPGAIDELRGYLLDSMATASPHAFGRPPRSGKPNLNIQSYVSKGKYDHDYYAGFYWYPDAIPLREKEYDEFIYFDHQHFKSFDDSIALENLKAVDAWYDAHKPFPMSKYLLPHWYEFGSNVIPHVSEKWGMEYIGQTKAADRAWADSVPWLKGGPFRLYEAPGTSTNNPENRGKNPVYYADFTAINGKTFFNCLTEIRDDAGYEWAPDNNVEASVGRGVRQLSRAFSSLALAVLFTHETDFIYRIAPESWNKELQGIWTGISSWNPVSMTSDKALRIVRAYRTSRMKSCGFRGNNLVKLEFTGKADVATCIYLFTEKDAEIKSQMIQVPPFENELKIKSNY